MNTTGHSIIQTLKNRLQFILFLFIYCCLGIETKAGVFDHLDRSGEEQYLVRLTNGEILLGSIVDMVDDKGAGDGKGIKLKTEIGVATIYEIQVREIQRLDESYRQSHRVFVMPTAEPISNNHYIGNVELFALWAGFGIADIGSVTVMRTFIPSISSQEQASVLNLKATVYEEKYETMTGKFQLALGANIAWLNAANRITDLYLSTTYTRVRSRITGILFANISGAHSDLFTATAGTIGNAVIRYPSGAIGFGIGVDTRFPGRQDLHFIGELWNANLASADNSTLILGLRLANSTVAFDFGIAVLTAPLVIPVTSFSWTPF